MLFGLLVTALLIQLSICQEIPDDKNGILEWYYNLNHQNYNSVFPRLRRQTGQFNSNDYDSNSNEDDDWYVFDEVGPETRPRSNPNNNFGWVPQQGPFQGQRGQQQGQFQGPFRGQGARQQAQFQGPFRGQRPGQFIPNDIPTTTERITIPNSGVRPNQCTEACSARTTPEYNPVCGSDGNTYASEAKLMCAASCGVDVQLRMRGRCGPLLPPLAL